MMRISLALTAFAIVASFSLLAGESDVEVESLVKKLGGAVLRDEKAKDRPITSVSFRERKLADADLKKLASAFISLKQVQSVDLNETTVNTTLLKEISSSPRLIALTLDGCPGVTDEGLKEIAKAKGLKSLHLRDCKNVTDAGIKELSSLQNLEGLYFADNQITDEALKSIGRLKKLEALWLYGTRVTDKGLPHLAELKSLKRLNLDSTRITNAGLNELSRLKSLEVLYLRTEGVTAVGIEELQKSLPKCKILK